MKDDFNRSQSYIRKKTRKTWITREEEAKQMARKYDEALQKRRLSMTSGISMNRRRLLKKNVSFSVKEKDHDDTVTLMSQNSLNTQDFQKFIRKYKNPYFIDIDNEAEIEEGAAVRFRQFQNHFIDMTKKKYIFTKFDIISVIITNDSKHAIAVLMESEKLYYVRIYGLENDDNYKEFMIRGTRITAKEVQ